MVLEEESHGSNPGFQTALREARKMAGMSVHALAASSRVSPRLLASIESGKADPRMSSLARIRVGLETAGIFLEYEFASGRWVSRMVPGFRPMMVPPRVEAPRPMKKPLKVKAVVALKSPRSVETAVAVAVFCREKIVEPVGKSARKLTDGACVSQAGMLQQKKARVAQKILPFAKRFFPPYTGS